MVSFGVEDFANRYGGLKPSQFADLIALSGDRSDNIPGYFVLLHLKDHLLNHEEQNRSGLWSEMLLNLGICIISY